jgi:hypothetical protein
VSAPPPIIAIIELTSMPFPSKHELKSELVMPVPQHSPTAAHSGVTSGAIAAKLLPNPVQKSERVEQEQSLLSSANIVLRCAESEAVS